MMFQQKAFNKSQIVMSASFLKAPSFSGMLSETTKQHHYWTSVYLADTDSGGMVYHANYLNFAERARTEFLNLLGIRHSQMMQEGSHSCFFVVRDCSISFFKSATFGDLLEVQTTFKKMTKVRLFLLQEIFKEKVLIARLHITLACVKNIGSPIGIPHAIVSAVKPFLKEDPIEASLSLETLVSTFLSPQRKS